MAGLAAASRQEQFLTVVSREAALAAFRAAVPHAALPAEPVALWSWIEAADQETVAALFAVCVAASVDAGSADWTTADGAREPFGTTSHHASCRRNLLPYSTVSCGPACRLVSR